jgi:hypothetical protein
MTAAPPMGRRSAASSMIAIHAALHPQGVIPRRRGCEQAFPGRPSQVRHDRALVAALPGDFPAAEDAVLLVRCSQGGCQWQVADHDAGLKRCGQRVDGAGHDGPGGWGGQVDHLPVARPVRGGGAGAVVAGAGQ